MQRVTQTDIYDGFKKLGILGKNVLVHSSLGSFGHVVGGADTVLNVLIDSFETILMPAFCWDSNTVPPENDRPGQNGCDYTFYDDWNKEPKPFIVAEADVERSIGTISRRMVSLPGVKRSDHAWHSWVAYGIGAEYLTHNHSWDTTNLPIERLVELDGQLVLLGVTLTSCTAIHVSEELVGRRSFIRWATHRDGDVRRVRAAGCAKGFNNLIPYCADIFDEAHVGGCRILTTPLKAFIERMAEVIRDTPEITRCSDTCLRCKDTLLGGPLE